MLKSFSGSLLLAIFLFFSGTGNSYSETKFSPENELVRRADQYFVAENYESALPDYSRLLSLYPKEIIYNYRFGVCLLIAGKEKSNASTYLEVASKDPSVPDEVWFYLGKSYMVNNDFSKAKSAFEKFKEKSGGAKSPKFDTDKHIQNCESGISLEGTRKNIVILNSNQVAFSGFYNSFDYNATSGRLVNAADQFLTETDIKKQKDPVMFMSNDKQKILLSSYGKRGDSGKDIFIIRKTPDNQWAQPENLGQAVNTPADEDYPFLDRDGKTLYFSSKGHNSIGGYDIYKTVFDYNTNKWSSPENLGIPINTIGDDILFVPENKGNVANYATNVESDKNSIAIRKIQLPGGFNEMLTITGTYIPLDQKVRRDARITILTSSGDGIITSVNTDPVTGNYELVLKPGEVYMIVVEGGGYLPHSEIFELPGGLIEPQLRQEVKLNKTEEKEELTLLNYFSSGSGNVEPIKTISRSYAVNSDTSQLIPVVINDRVVYVTPPSSESVEESKKIANEKSETDSDSLPSIKIIKRDKYDPTLQQGLSSAEIRQQREEEERVREVNEEESRVGNDFDISMSNDELARVAYAEADALKGEADSLDREVVKLRVSAEKKISLSEEQKSQSEVEGINADTAALLVMQAETNRIEANDLNRKAEELASIAATKENEAKAALIEADIIFNGKSELTSADSVGTILTESVADTEVDSIFDVSSESAEIAGINSEVDIDSSVQNVNENITPDEGIVATELNESKDENLIPKPAEMETTSDDAKSENLRVKDSEEFDPSKPRLVVINNTIVEIAPEPVKPELEKTEIVKPEVVTAAVITPLPKSDSIENENPKNLNPGFATRESDKQKQELVSSTEINSELFKKEAIIAETSSQNQKTVSNDSVKPAHDATIPVNTVPLNTNTTEKNVTHHDATSGMKQSIGNSEAPVTKTETKNLNTPMDKQPVVEEVRILYRAYQEKNNSSKENSRKSLELQDRISKMKPSPERDQLIRESNDLALQSIRDREEAIKNIKEARLIDPNVEYKMGVNDYKPDYSVTARQEEKKTQQPKSPVVANVDTKNAIEQPALIVEKEIQKSEAALISNQESKEQLASMEKKQEVLEKEQKKEISYSKETESEEGLDKTHPEYPKYIQIKGDITNKQVETIDVFASAVNMNKKAIEEKEKELALMDQARMEQDTVKKSSMLRESFANKDSAEKHSKQSQEMFVKAQEHTRTVKGLRHELAVAKDNIISNPVNKTAAVSNDKKINEEKNQPVIVENTSVKSNVNGNTENNGTNVPFERKEITEKEQLVITTKVVAPEPENSIYAMAKEDDAAFNVSESDLAAVKISKQAAADFRKNVFSMDGASPYSSNNPIPMNPELPEGLVFKVQVGAFHKPLNNDVFKGLQPISGETTRPGWIRYCVGLFRTFEPAVIAKNEVRGHGYKDAFVVAYYNGKRIELHDAYRMLKEKDNLLAYKTESTKEVASLRAVNIHANASGSDDNDVRSFYGKPLLPSVSTEDVNKEYAVQVGVFRNAVPPVLIASMQPLQSEELKSGLYRYTFGHFMDYKHAEVARQSAVAAGVTDAFIVTYRKTGEAVSARPTKVNTPVNSVTEATTHSDVKEETLSAKGLIYKVQIGAYKKDIPYSLVESFEGIMDMGITKETDTRDLHVFYAGSCLTYSEALKLKDEISGKGVKDAFIVALKDGKRVPITELMKK